MDPTQREQMRLSVLRYLDAAAESNPGRGISAAVLRQHLVAEGQPADLTRVNAELVYLEGHGYVERVKKGFSPEVPLWLITSKGRDEYARIAG